jgi:mannose-6-phosphate isomerase-like protein (cupin superfamily)
MAWETRTVGDRYDLLAPDGSEIRMLPRVERASMVHCRLGPGQVTRAVRHRSVDELWYCLAGRGELWRNDGNTDEVVDLLAGVAVSIPLGTSFQFRAGPATWLDLLIATAPAWPGADEAIPAQGRWSPALQGIQ